MNKKYFLFGLFILLILVSSVFLTSCNNINSEEHLVPTLDQVNALKNTSDSSGKVSIRINRTHPVNSSLENNSNISFIV